MVYLAIALTIAIAWFLYRSRAGLVLRAVGESPESAHALGYPVRRIRLAAVVVGGALCGVAGAYISVVYTPLWVEGMVAGKGWIALALTTFATWRPARVLLGAYLFGGVTMLQFHLQGEGVQVPSQFLTMLPYLATIVVLVLISRNAAFIRVNMPASIGKPFFPGFRDNCRFAARKITFIHHWSHHDSTLETVLRPTRRLELARRGGRSPAAARKRRRRPRRRRPARRRRPRRRPRWPPRPSRPLPSGPLKIAFAYVGPVGDGGWTFAHDNARKALEKEFGDKVQTSFVEKVPEAADAERVFRDMAGQGNKLIFGTTFGYMEPMLKVAADLKDVKFEHATGYKTAENMRTYDSRTYEGAYMAGVIAGGMTKTNTLGVVGSIPIPEVIRNINSFTMGAQSVNPKIKTKVVWVNEWFNPPKETEAAQSLINGGADVLMQNTDSSAVLQTAEEGRQVRLRLGQRHDRLRPRRRTWPRRSSTGRRTTSRPPTTRSTAPGRRPPAPGGASRKARSTSSRSPTRCPPT